MSNCECNDYISISALYAKMEKGVSSNEIITVNYQLCGNNQNIVWSSTDENVVTVSYNKNTNKVTITAKKVGTATIWAHCEEDRNIQDYCLIEVLDKMPVTKVKFDPDEIFIEKGKTEQLNTIVYPLGAGNRTLSWTSDNESIATVTNAGVVTAKEEGTALITATATDGSGKSDVCIVRVNAGNCLIEKITFEKSEITLTQKKNYDNDYELTPENVYNKKLRWSSSNRYTAAVNPESGEVYPISNGTAVITVVDEYSGVSASYVAKVQLPVPVCCLELNEHNLELEKGKTYQLKIKNICPENATTDKFNWYSSNTGRATVSDTGLVTAKSKGYAVITVAAADGNGATDVCHLHVDPTYVNEIKIGPFPKDMIIGGTFGLAASVQPENATNKTITWSSDKTDVIKVEEDGRIEAVGIGTAKIYATANDKGGVSSYIEITVSPKPNIQSVKMCPESVTIMKGHMKKVNCEILPPNAVHNKVVFTSNDTSIATVDEFGWVTAKSAGTTYITATVSDEVKTYTASCKVEVDPREEVFVRKDGDFFIVQFRDGKMWKSTGKILQHPNQYDVEVSEPRFIHNRTQYFTEKQLAFLYLLDPVGVVSFMKDEYASAYNVNGVDLLFVKDRIYKSIFGVEPRYFSERSDGTVQYHNYNGKITDEQRMIVYSDAEVLFGSHFVGEVFEWVKLINEVVSVIFDTVVVGVATEIIDQLFFSGSVTDLFSDNAKSYLEDCVAGEFELIHWVDDIVGVLGAVNDLFSMPKVALPIFNKIQVQEDYMLVVSGNCYNMTIRDIIESTNANI